MKILVFTTVYPNSINKQLGLFVKNRMSQVANHCDIVVVAPVPYFFLNRLMGPKKKKFPPFLEIQEGVEVYHPKFHYIPGFLKFMDGFFLYWSTRWVIRKIQKTFDFDLIDGHFIYPDGFAAVQLGKYFKKPVTITLRGTINSLVHHPGRRQAIGYALKKADKVFSVSRYLADFARKHFNIDQDKFVPIPNGVDPEKFRTADPVHSRNVLKIDLNRKVLVSVGGLVQRKGHHRVLEIIPELVHRFPNLLYIIVGGGTVEGNIQNQLINRIAELRIQDHVMLAGEVSHESVHTYLCASDVFALATQFEGWANVFFEAMACGLPVVTTDVCGNPEVVKQGETGILVPFGDQPALKQAIMDALTREWNRLEISRYALSRPWEKVGKEVVHNLASVIENWKSSRR